jgi:hypothetical protein
VDCVGRASAPPRVALMTPPTRVLQAGARAAPASARPRRDTATDGHASRSPPMGRGPSPPPRPLLRLRDELRGKGGCGSVHGGGPAS